MIATSEKRCLLCGNVGQADASATQFLGLNQSDRRMRVFHCSQCRFRWLDPQPSAEEIQQLYTHAGYFERPEQHYSYDNQAHEARPCLTERVARFQKDAPKGHVLDIGCATGEFLAIAGEQTLRATGIEISEYAYGVAARRNLNVILGDLYSDQLLPHEYSGIHMSHVLEHLPDPTRALQRVYELLRPGGIAYIEVPHQFESAPDILDRWQGQQMEFGPFSIHHVSFFTPTSLVTLFRQNGFDVLKLRTYLPCRRASREPSMRLMALKSFLWAADRFLQRGDIISAWIRRDKNP